MTNDNDKSTTQALEIEEVAEPATASDADLANATGGVRAILATDRLISNVREYDFGAVAIKVGSIRQGVAMLQSGHTPTPDVAAIRGAAQLSKLSRI